LKIIGILMLVGGLIGLIVGFTIDTTVASGTAGGRVHNIGLRNDKQNLLLVSSAISVVGAIFVGFGSRAKSNVTSMPPQERTCPICAERITVEATVCPYCQRVLPPVDNFASGSSTSSSAGLATSPAQIPEGYSFSTDQAAQAIGVTRGTLQGYIRSGRINVNPGGAIDAAELLRAGFIIRNVPPGSA